jgi:hypothetical protein
MPLDIAPADDSAADALQERFRAAIRELTDGFGLVVAHITAHPRHNEKVERATELLGVLEESAGIMRTLIAAQQQDELDHLTALVALLERAAAGVRALAEENAVKEGSIAGKPLRPAPRLVEEGSEDEYGPRAPSSGDSSN